MSIVDVLSSFGIRSNPTPENVSDLIFKAAKSHIITKPMFALTGIMKGFYGFFSNFPLNSIEALYDNALPTNETVLDQLDLRQAIDKLEENTYQYLKRFIEEADSGVLHNFLRFVTGSSYIYNNSKIKVNCESMTELQAQPIAHTCVKKLTLSKCFCTYLAFKTNFEHCLENKEIWSMDDFL